jgi:hypothetical protein
MVNNTMHNYLMDHGVGKEDANTIVSMLLNDRPPQVQGAQRIAFSDGSLKLWKLCAG